MELKHIDIANLVVSSANMRVKGKTPDLTNILPSVRARGVLVPLIVRPGRSGGLLRDCCGQAAVSCGDRSRCGDGGG